jgi:hypothetical protein
MHAALICIFYSYPHAHFSEINGFAGKMNLEKIKNLYQKEFTKL